MNRRQGLLVVFLALVVAIWGLRSTLRTSHTPSDRLETSSAQRSAPEPMLPATTPHDSGQRLSASASDWQKVKLVDEILASHNDNDPRMDRELRVLSGAAKSLLEARYHEFAPEKRNEKGTIVFLVGRNLKTTEDVHFMQEVLGEPACLSLENCQKGAENATAEAHSDPAAGVTLAYPQLVALKALESYLSAKDSRAPGVLTPSVLDTLRRAQGSSVSRVSSLAREIYSRYRPSR